MIITNRHRLIKKNEIEFIPIRAGGPGGQHVNKTSSAVHLRFDINASSLPQNVKERLLRLKDKRITREGMIIIKSRDYRSQSRNRAEAYERLLEIIQMGMSNRKKRIVTEPTSASRTRRLKEKKKRGKLKNLRGKIDSMEN